SADTTRQVCSTAPWDVHTVLSQFSHHMNHRRANRGVRIVQPLDELGSQVPNWTNQIG
ncbi:10778_t:CDS:1, partial [Acaulospora colombiana]